MLQPSRVADLASALLACRQGVHDVALARRRLRTQQARRERIHPRPGLAGRWNRSLVVEVADGPAASVQKGDCP